MAVAGLAVVACSGGDRDPVEVFRDHLAEQGHSAATASDAALEQVGQVACDQAARADSSAQLVAGIMAATAGQAEGERRELVGVAGAAIGAFCPDQADRLGLG